MALNQVNKSLHYYERLFNDFERHSKVDMNDDVMCNCFITGLANGTFRTHAMSHRAKLVTPLTIVELQNMLNRDMVDSPHPGRDDHSQDDTSGNGAGRGI
jgi:pyruvate dehydrogenase complex dehydrogenase (E1) component